MAVSNSNKPKIYSDWYRPPTRLPGFWSTDWNYWEGVFLFEEIVDGNLKIDKLSKDVWDVPGTVAPLAYVEGAGDEYWVFIADGQYYCYRDERLFRFEGEYQSKEDFLHRYQEFYGTEKVEIPRQPGNEGELLWLFEGPHVLT
ncbi:hypothetical protein C8R47DRAFT_1229477 [Mycena vitilis]|nr:hypothetical protein C8R47DRAFT_1229477 [Mycena vitilis]